MSPFKTVLSCVSIGLLSFSMIGSFAHAQQNASASTPTPPTLEKVEEGEAPAITIRGATPSETQITQKREQGRVTSVKVHSGKNTYYAKPNTPAGSALPGDAQSDATRGAQWQVKEFDMKRQQDQKRSEAASVPVPPAAEPKP